MRVNITPDINNKFNPNEYNQKFILDTYEVSNIDAMNDILFDAMEQFNEDKKNTPMFSLYNTSSDHFLRSNWESTSGIVLDIDEGCTIDEFLEFNKWNCILYTTHSHTSEINRFRVIYLFNREVSLDDYEIIKYGIKKTFKSIKLDKSCLSFRSFILPPQNSTVYTIKDKIDLTVETLKVRGFGDYKDFMAKEVIKKRKISQTKRMNALTKKYTKKDDPLQYLKNYIGKIEWEEGTKHMTIVNIIYKFKELELSYDQIINTLRNNVDFRIEEEPLANLNR